MANDECEDIRPCNDANVLLSGVNRARRGII